MSKARQDAWSKEEDTFLAEIVLHHISNGKTQLEAFQHAAEGLDRTPAACGYRWNAEVRQQYLGAIETAKSKRKKIESNHMNYRKVETEDSIDSVIMMLEQVKANALRQGTDEDEPMIVQLTEENQLLQEKIKWYEDAWREMGKLWQWTNDMNGSQK